MRSPPSVSASSEGMHARSRRPRHAQAPSVSLLEAGTNVAFGFVLALVIQAIIYPLYGIHTTFVTDGTIAVIFTIASLLRSYLVRRAFETFGCRPVHNPKAERLHARP